MNVSLKSKRYFTKKKINLEPKVPNINTFSNLREGAYNYCRKGT